MINQLKIKNGLYFVNEVISNNVKTSFVSVPTHHILVIDCSGSMYSDLPLIRKQLKNKLPDLVKEGDSVSIIWFSGKNEYGVLKEEVYVKSLKELGDLNNAIDRFLQPMGLTGFVGPLNKTEELIKRISQSSKNDSKFSMLFLTDGYDNQHSKSDILAQVSKLSTVVNSATFVEYGYYCNRQLLTQMAENIGGISIFSESFDDYDPIFDNFIKNTEFSSKKIEHTIKTDVKNGYVFSIDNDNIVTYKVEDNKVLLPDDVTHIYYLNNEQINLSSKNDIDLLKLYSLLYTLSVRMLSDDIYPVLSYLGDKYLIDKYTNAFGKFNITEFQSICYNISNGNEVEYKDGMVDQSYLPDENAYCVMDLLNDLGESKENLFFPGHETFSYNRIGSLKEQKSSKVSDEDINKLKLLTEQLTGSKDLSNLDEITKEINEIKTRLYTLKFENLSKNFGFEMNDFVYNSTRPNVSVRVRYDGYVDLSKLDNPKLEKVDTFIYRTYTLIKDGIINVRQLPVILSEETYNKIKSATELLNGTTYNREQIYVLDLSKLPTVNRNMVSSISSKELANKSYELLQLQAKQKVFKYYKDKFFPKQSVGFVDKYGKETTDWLKELGITEYNGFAPKYTSIKSGEMYNSTELDVKIGGFSSLPSVNDVLKKTASGKFTPREELLYRTMVEYENFIASDDYKDSKNQDEYLKVWLENKANSAIKRTRVLNNEIAKIIFSLILSQNWFTDLESIEDKTCSLDIDGKLINFEFVLTDKAVEI